MLMSIVRASAIFTPIRSLTNVEQCEDRMSLLDHRLATNHLSFGVYGDRALIMV